MRKDKLAVIILAAGKSTRMKSDTPKVLHPVCGRPMIEYVFDLAGSLRADRTICVLGHRQEEVRRVIPKGVDICLQRRLLGSADAVKRAVRYLKGFKGTLLVLYADTPLVKKETVRKLLKFHNENGLSATLLCGQLNKPEGYGRILRDKYSSVCGIVEEKDADEADKEIREVNTGIICFDKASLAGVIGLVRRNRRKKEYYLTDAISLLYKKGLLVDAFKIQDINEALGVNCRLDLARVNRIMQARINEGFMQQGVSIIEPGSTLISYGVKIGQDSVIYPFTVIERNVTIGKRCSVGPFARLREGTRLADDVTFGNFVESVRTSVGPKTLAKHFCYLGDSRIGEAVIIGAGTVTANFNGRNKNATIIGSRVLVGSDTVFVAPVKVGRDAKTGAGSVVVKGVGAKDTVVGVPARPLKKTAGKR